MYGIATVVKHALCCGQAVSVHHSVHGDEALPRFFRLVGVLLLHRFVAYKNTCRLYAATVRPERIAFPGKVTYGRKTSIVTFSEFWHLLSTEVLVLVTSLSNNGCAYERGHFLTNPE